jgi:hypothetical protein
MDTMALTRLAAPRKLRVTLTAGPAAAAAARNEVRAAIRAWDVPVASSVAARLTSELVANALKHGAGGDLKHGAAGGLRHGAGTAIELVVSCAHGQLQVDVYDTSPARELPVGAPSGAERPGQMLLASLSTSWGYYRTPAGNAGFFALMF